jgi:hypothetical protein
MKMVLGDGRFDREVPLAGMKNKCVGVGAATLMECLVLSTV